MSPEEFTCDDCGRTFPRAWSDAPDAPVVVAAARRRRRERFTYPFRRARWWIASAESSCNVRWCARPTVGLSRYCRSHTDEILARRKEEK